MKRLEPKSSTLLLFETLAQMSKRRFINTESESKRVKTQRCASRTSSCLLIGVLGLNGWEWVMAWSEELALVCEGL